MRRISGILLAMVMVLSVGLSAVNAQDTLTYTTEEQRLADTPTKFGFKGLYTIFSPDTSQKGKFGLGLFWDLTRFCLPGDPRYPQLMELTLAGYYGITDRLEVGVSAPFRSLKIPAASTENRAADDLAVQDDVSESGISNVGVGLRFNLLRAENFEMTPYILAFLPTASDPEAGTGADNTRIHFGVSMGTVLENLNNTRLYGQVAYQLATDYDQDRGDFSEVNPAYPRPRFERFGTNPLFHEYGNTLFYSAGLAVPMMEDQMELFSEFLFYHSFDDPDYIPMYEDGEELDVVQDGGMANVGLKVGFGNGVALAGGWGGILFAEEPMYESPHWHAFAALTYNKPETVEVVVVPPEKVEEKGPGEVGEIGEIYQPPVGPTVVGFDCSKLQLAMVNFEFDKSTLTLEAIQKLKEIGKMLRVCGEMTVEVQGHTDWIGTENYNMGLGNRRARAVVYYLVYDEGIDPARVVRAEKLSQGIIAGETYGESQPITSNETDAGRAQNRRAQFLTLKIDNRVITQ